MTPRTRRAKATTADSAVVPQSSSRRTSPAVSAASRKAARSAPGFVQRAINTSSQLFVTSSLLSMSVHERTRLLTWLGSLTDADWRRLKRWTRNLHGGGR